MVNPTHGLLVLPVRCPHCGNKWGYTDEGVSAYDRTLLRFVKPTVIKCGQCDRGQK